MTESPEHDRRPDDVPEGDGLEGYRARYQHFRAQGLDHNAAQRAASNKGADPSGASDRPPRPSGTGRAGGARGGRPRSAGCAKPVAEMTSTIGAMAALADPYTGAVLIDRAEDLGKAVDKAAVHNPRIREFVNGLAAGGVYGALIFTLLSILLPIAARWGLIPEPYGSKLMVMLAPESQREEATKMAAGAAAPGSGPAPADQFATRAAA